ncbi:orotate phosphoribosyltransferase [Magnetococcus marinus MC-1]|uniref:Orotate phosphoribosyltransferase n=1 Tax=Magnetococcus marinus (strain ATCC BAA-1437 / JCM 17883 / MC-1) TaxID=156889 RepID=A0LE24_MAGMM|nr:orotate phosphoribosyltransferase [Magnetococcus marinus]ABK46217.1 orotate phosphoribosyltransferase [Magnetococcus marinus MC-1]
MNQQRRIDFLRFALAAEVLRFGTFKTKAGRLSPYFFNAGLFNTGALMSKLAAFYADTLAEQGPEFDLLFGPAYKGIPLATAVAMALAERHGRETPFAYNRKEAKDHGEGGVLVGAPLHGRVMVIDDVVSAGTSVRESVALIERAGAQLAGVTVALDRQERGQGALSAIQEIEQTFAVPVIAIASLSDLVALLEQEADLAEHMPHIKGYRDTYGVVA